jgi:hypothetical protein
MSLDPTFTRVLAHHCLLADHPRSAHPVPALLLGREDQRDFRPGLPLPPCLASVHDVRPPRCGSFGRRQPEAAIVVDKPSPPQIAYQEVLMATETTAVYISQSFSPKKQNPSRFPGALYPREGLRHISPTPAAHLTVPAGLIYASSRGRSGKPGRKKSLKQPRKKQIIINLYITDHTAMTADKIGHRGQRHRTRNFYPKEWGQTQLNY